MFYSQHFGCLCSQAGKSVCAPRGHTTPELPELDQPMRFRLKQIIFVTESKEVGSVVMFEFTFCSSEWVEFCK